MSTAKPCREKILQLTFEHIFIWVIAIRACHTYGHRLSQERNVWRILAVVLLIWELNVACATTSSHCHLPALLTVKQQSTITVDLGVGNCSWTAHLVINSMWLISHTADHSPGSNSRHRQEATFRHKNQPGQ